MSLFLQTSKSKHFVEHHHCYFEDVATEFDVPNLPQPILFLQNEKAVCFEINARTRRIQTSYFIGVDWIIEKEKAIYVEPKLNKNATEQTDYLKMLFSALKHPEVAKHTEDLFEIKWDKTPIAITPEQDLLSPLLVVQYLRLVKEIVRKGLKKSYYKVENDLYAKVKGKVMVSQTIKQNLVKNKPLHTYCSYDEFGLNSLENRLLKKALVFIQRYLPTIKNLQNEKYTTEIFNYINPAFEFVSDEVNHHEVKQTKTNVFYKEYDEAIRLAKLILKRFGYNISNTQQKTIQTPPFWIDMSKLFELYVLGLLKDAYGSHVLYGRKEAKLNYGLPDYLITKEGIKCIADAKYKPLYNKSGNYDIENIRQLSGYARDEGVFKKLDIDATEIIDCVLIYPLPIESNSSVEFKIDLEQAEDLGTFVKFKKIGVSIPTIHKT
ncbi:MULTISPECIES: 5-methylcytosine restriction system specificity protein McrC [unclassified Flavobacterium]|uniref:5-methylcytosine restriction system specificity protein McrC n=1 Tax=unclassified Flavobacterium TaxID=196869 RepID=UPI003F92E6F1